MQPIDIFLTMWTKFPLLLYRDYMGNAQLLAEWLGVECTEEINYTTHEFRILDSYSIQKLSSITGLPAAVLIDSIHRKWNDMKKVKHAP